MGSISTDHEEMEARRSLSEPLAIVGLATRFPQDTTSTEELWKFLLKGRSAHTKFPEDRIGTGHYHPDPEHGGSFSVKGAHFLSEDPAYFDAPFFSITKGEVMALDPQQRVVLENVYHALENAGMPIPEVTGSNTSVFVSGFNHDHLANLNADPESTMKYKPTGTTNSLLSNRVSWFFDFKSLSVTLDTACSSSMVALHLGCQSLRTGECNMAVISGVTMISFPTDISSMGHHGFLSSEGKSFSFDHRADGYARGEGVGSVIVKRFSDAVQDGNVIRAVIRGTGVNQDGRTPGISMPSSAAQESLMRKVYADAALDFQDTMMVEAHGTGTAAGDPIETNAIAKVFASRRSKIPLYVGAIKSGIGHLEGGAGVAGIIKGVLILENGIIPPNINFEKVNPKIPLKKWNLQFPLKPVPWPSSGVRRISINSFGVGGTNAHTVLDDAYSYLTNSGVTARHNTIATVPYQGEIDALVKKLQTEAADASDDAEPATNGVHANGEVKGMSNGNSPEHIEPAIPRLIPLTSYHEAGVTRSAQAQAEYVKSLENPKGAKEQAFMDDFAYTMTKRSQFPWRSWALASNWEELAENLTTIHKPIRCRNPPKIGFIFTGQGAQWFGMGQELLAYPVYRQSLVDATAYMKSLGSPWSLADELLRSKTDTIVNQPHLAHPACAALQIALVDLLDSWSIRASRVVGHSSGEIAAAYCAGKLTREAAWKLAYFRGFVSSRQLSAKGSMMAVGLSEANIRPYLEKINVESPGELIVACYNSPKNQTVSGDDHKVDLLKKVLEEDQVFCRKLLVKNAYHSSHMKEVAGEYLERLGTLPQSDGFRYEFVEMFSTVTAEKIEDDHLAAQYWVDNLVSPVQFGTALSKMCFDGGKRGQAPIQMNTTGGGNVFSDVTIELGPHATLQSAVKEILAATPYASAVTSFAVLNRSNPGLSTILNTVGQLYARGSPIDISTINESFKSTAVKPPLQNKPRLLVTLPGYVFNHSERLVYESRLSKNYRLRKEPRHDLFGAPVVDWNIENPRWRNILRLSEQPWLKDHIVTNQVVLPGVGYLIAAIEASRQIAANDREVTGFRLRDIALKRALIIPDHKDGVEVMLSMSRMDEASLQASLLWRKFAVSSFNPVADDWIEHCTGYIATDYEAVQNPIDQGLEEREEKAAWSNHLDSASERCVTPLEIDDVYDNLVTTGLAFGPLFRNLSEVKGTVAHSGEILGTVTVPDIAAAMPKGFAHSHLIHPATMDSFMHFFLSSVMDATSKTTLERPMVPTFIKDVWVSADLSPQPDHQFVGYGKSNLLAYDKYESNIRIWDKATREPRVSIQGVRATPLEAVDSDSSAVRKLNHEIKWTPYLDLLKPSAFADVPVTSKQDNLDYLRWIEKFQMATLILLTDALEELGNKPPEGLQGHLIRYFDWMQYTAKCLQEDKVAGMRLATWQEYKQSSAKKDQLLKDVAEHNADGALALRMGKAIVKVLRGEEDPLHLMFGIDDLLDRVYAQVAHLGDLPALQASLLKIIADNSTNLRVIEVGAGTGGSTTGMLENLTTSLVDGGLVSSVSTYTFTDISSAFFEKAKEKFRLYRDLIEYKVLDIEKDASKQGFELGTYDIIVAQNVVHATTDLKNTFQNMRSFLKPGGKMILQEGVRQDFCWSTIAFGQLPGWWAGVEPARRRSPWIPSEEWNKIIKASSFSGVDLELPDRPSTDLHTQSTFVATAVDDTERSPQFTETAIITSMSLSEGTSELCQALKTFFEQVLKVPRCSIIHHLDLAKANLDRVVCISVIELEQSLLSDLKKEEFENIRQMLCICKGMIWITGDMEKHPELGMMTGLTRTVRWERDVDEVNLVNLAISEPRPAIKDLVESIGTLYSQQFNGSLPYEKANGEFVLRNGVFLTSRLVEATAADTYLNSQFSKSKPIMTPYKDAGRPIKLATSAPGLLNKLEWVTDEVYEEPLADTHVEIDIKAVAMNFRDLMIAMGEHMAYSMGNEAAGVITRVGAQVKDIKVGDRVVYLCGIESTGCFHTFGRVDQNVIVRIPDHMSYEIACGLPCVYATVIYGLVDAGRLEKDEKILIHAAAGGVGQAAIHYAKYIGAEIFATVSSLEKRELIMKLGVREDHIFSSRDLTFVKGIMRATNGKGVDLVLNSLSGEALRRSWDLLAPFGRFVEIGKKDAQNNGRVELRPFLHNVTMTSVELPTMMRHRPSLIKRLTEDTVRLWTEGHIKEADPTIVMNYSQVEEGLRILQSGKGMGKMVFVPTTDDLLPIVPPKPPVYDLKEDATYLMAGGLGGIGRSFARWMAKHGARSLLFMSSTGNITPAVEEMIRELEADKCKAKVIRCDVSDADRLRAVLEECKKTMPPIKGVIQGAMKLKDTMFENMQHEEFQLVVKPKVQGSWNLHDLLPRDMDFFVMLSSATGVLGNRAQANYAAGNTYQDALAHHRHTLGLPASTIDLGQVLSVGYVAENRERAAVAKHLATVLEVIREDEIHVLLEYLMDNRCSPPAQLTSGLTTALSYAQRGMPTPSYLGFPLFTHLRNTNSSSSSGSDGEGGVRVEALLNAATTLDEAAEIVLNAVRTKLSSLLAVTIDDVDPNKSVSYNGVDSLVAMEFRTYLVKEVKADIPVLEIQGTMSVADLSRKIAGMSSAVEIREVKEEEEKEEEEK